MYVRTGLGTLRSLRERLSHYKFEVHDPQPLVPALETRMAAGVAEALERIGRCEDLRFSPDGTRLAIPGYHTRMCLVLAIAFDDEEQVVHLNDFLEIESPGITLPHGLDWVNDTALAVANRNGSVAIVDVPREMAGRRLNEEALSIVQGKGFSKMAWPGSVAVTRTTAGATTILACNNYVDRITEHVIDPGARFAETDSSVMYARGLYIPDGIAVSPDRRWIAVSCHGSHSVAIYSAHRTGRFAAPVARLSGPRFPHGLRFTADGQHLLVADAGSPYMHVFERGAGWPGARSPIRSVQVLDDETYLRGRTQPDEGGPKGVDIHPGGRFVAICCEEVRLKLAPLDGLLGSNAPATAGALPVV